MKHLFSVILFFAFTSLQANTYYVSSVSGDDKRSANEAQNAATPWRSLGKINSSFGIFQPGDSILLKRSETFPGFLSVTGSGNINAPLVFAAYGTGSRPVINGFTTLKTWTLSQTGIYTSSSPYLQDVVNMVVVNGKMKAAGRYPNYGYIKIEKTNGSSQIAGQLSNLPDFTGGELVIRKNRWIIDKNDIRSQTPASINYTSGSSYPAAKGFGFFIQNHKNTLDKTGEWYYNADKKQVGVFFGTQSPALFGVQAAFVTTLVSLNNESDVVFDGIAFKGSVKSAFEIKNANRITIRNSEIFYSGTNAINASNTDNLTLSNTSFKYTNNVALNFSNCSNAVVTGNKIRYTGVYPGMGESGDGSYEAIVINGDNNRLELNTIDSTGYIPVSFRGNTVNIKNNFINNFAFVKDDGGGIYSWNNGENAPVNYGRQITGNIVLNGKGAGAGTDNLLNLPAHGIYMDDNVNDVEITGNTVANCGRYGIFVHNAYDLKLDGNTSFNNGGQAGMVHDDNAVNTPIRLIQSVNNIFFSKNPATVVADFKTIGDDLSHFGTFNNNRYCRPFDDNLTMYSSFIRKGTWISKSLSLDGWKKDFKQDKDSKGADAVFSPFKVKTTSGSNKFSNGSFAANIGGLYCYSPASNCVLAWKSGVLDEGALQVSFNRLTGSTDRASVIIGVGEVTAGKSYVLKFTMIGTAENKAVETFLRKSLSGYNDLSEREYTLISAERSENEVVFTAGISEANASIVFNVEEQGKPLYLDNIRLYEASVAPVDPDDYIRFEYNATAYPKTISLDSRNTDVNNKVYSKTITLAPFTSIILMKPGTANKDTAVSAVACSATGAIEFEQWSNISGNDVANIPLETPPNKDSQLNVLEFRDAGVNYGSRFSGYLCAPQSGAYTFFLSGDDAAELWLSTNDDPGNKTRIANLLSWTRLREWNKFPSQRSAPVTLVKGHKYYLEILHKQGNGGGHVSVAWTLPDSTTQAPMSATYLSPFATSADTKIDQTLAFDSIADKTLGNAAFALHATASSGLPVTFAVRSGPAVVSGDTLTLTGLGTVVIQARQTGNAVYSPAASARSFRVLAASSTACSATGNILLEQWKPVIGNALADIPVGNSATSRSYLNTLEFSNNGNNYGVRISGYICPPQTGSYTFYIAGDDAAGLWLSTNSDPVKKQKIAGLPSWTGFRDYTVFPSQKSAAITLKSGQKYYIEVLLKQGEGQDHVSVAWQMPDGVLESPIPGSRLSPFTSSARKANDVGQTPAAIEKPALYAFPNPASSDASIVYNPVEAGQVTLAIRDLNGKTIQPFFKGLAEKGTPKKFVLKGNQLPGGTYIISLTSRTEVLTQKIIITH